MEQHFQADIEAVGRISAVPTILDVVCRTTGMGFAAVARVTEDRWIACSVKDDIAFGLVPGGELKVETTICHEIRASGDAVVIDHVAENAAWRTHHTPLQYGFQSYISMPIVRADGSFFGTLCAIDPNPARLETPEIVGMFKLFAELIAFHLDAHDSLAASEASLAGERTQSQLRDEFIAVLGHDLRNPLAAIDAGARLLEREKLDPKTAGILKLMQTSVSRMSALINNVLDFARGRLGGGLAVERHAAAPLAPLLEQVIAEFRSGTPDRTIDAEIAIDLPVRCDEGRIAQLLSNLIGNALTHGAVDGPIRVRAATEGEVFELSVANGGTPIPEATQAKLFQPFTRGEIQQHKEGLGLGLYIASEIARAHNGALSVASSPEETRFTLRMPRG
ncbi:Adaptive-response sensory-kinase SasA [Alphaproteobacteria bacterium SO-S41]|nr:Adaptive-response sensory-kinase SasA [Alphaproteobacteria bacterium SO-S41]